MEWLATTAFQSPVSCLVAFGAKGIMCGAVCSASWVPLCAVGAVLGGCRWCVTIAIVAGGGCSLPVLADCIHRFGAVEDLLLAMLNGKAVHCNVSQLTRGCLQWFCYKFPKELSLMAVCMDDMATQFMLAMLIIDHLAVVHQCLDACNKILGVLSQPGHNIFEFSEAHMGADIRCHSLLDTVKEGRSFCLGHSLPSLLPIGTHCTCISRDLVPRVAKTYLRWSSLSGMMQLREEPVLQGMLKYGEGVVCIF